MHNAGKCYDRNIFNQHIKNLIDTIKSIKGEQKEHSSSFSSLPGTRIQIPVCKCNAKQGGRYGTQTPQMKLAATMRISPPNTRSARRCQIAAPRMEEVGTSNGKEASLGCRCTLGCANQRSCKVSLKRRAAFQQGGMIASGLQRLRKSASSFLGPAM